MNGHPGRGCGTEIVFDRLLELALAGDHGSERFRHAVVHGAVAPGHDQHVDHPGGVGDVARSLLGEQNGQLDEIAVREAQLRLERGLDAVDLRLHVGLHLHQTGGVGQDVVHRALRVVPRQRGGGEPGAEADALEQLRPALTLGLQILEDVDRALGAREQDLEPQVR